MISIQNVSKRFGKFKAVDNINIEVEKGEIFGLLGLNGAGKTTTQRMVSTVFQPSEGNITVNGFNSKSDSSEVRRNIGFLPTEVGLYDRLTAREVIKYFGILNETGSLWISLAPPKAPLLWNGFIFSLRVFELNIEHR